MTAYLRVYGFGHLRADCRGPGSAPEPYARFKYGTTFYYCAVPRYDRCRFVGGDDLTEALHDL